MFYTALFTVAKIWKHLKCSSLDELIKKMWYNGLLFSHKKGGNSAICNNMDELWGHYAKWNNSEWERKIPHNLTYM